MTEPDSFEYKPIHWLAEKLNVDAVTITRWQDDEGLPCYRFGSKRYVLPSEAAEWAALRSRGYRKGALLAAVNSTIRYLTKHERRSVLITPLTQLKTLLEREINND